MPEQQVAPVAETPETEVAEAPKPQSQNTAEQAPATAPEGDKPETGQDPEKQRSRRFERRLGNAYRKAAEAQARADFLEKQLNEFRQKQVPPADPEAPTLQKFTDIEEYAAAKAKFESEKAAKKALQEHQAKQHADAQRRFTEQLADSWEEKSSRADGKYEDFDEVVGDLKPTEPWSQAVMAAENAEDVAYWLGKNLDQAKRIASLPPFAQIREIGRIEERLLANPPVKPKTPSRAPAPIEPLKGVAPTVTDVPSSEDNMKDWMRKRQKQVHGRK